jgi:4-amino-4-deoxy-L-arabinose transferase-like glycosyltransferase
LLWFLVVLVFFSFSDTKRDLYLMPLLPPVALFVGSYLDALMGRRLLQSCFSRWLTAGYFGIVALVALAMPIAAWIYRKDAVWFLLPASLVLSVGGALTAGLLWRSSIGAAFAAAASMMTSTTLAASLWVFPYLETFKSPRSFAQQVNRIVPASSSLYIYADSMNDFNYYTGRETIPVLPGPAAVAALLSRGQNGYMLVKERDLKRLSWLPQERVVASDAKGGTVWHLAELGHSSTR